MTKVSRSKPRVLFVHGWTAAADFWAPLQAVLRQQMDVDIEVLDFGFYGVARMEPADEPDWVVAHSFGSLWAIRQWESWGRPNVISICGFTKFTADKDFRAGISPRVVSRMDRRLRAEPREQVLEFCKQAGPAEEAEPGQFHSATHSHYVPDVSVADVDQLSWGLCALKDWDLREQWRLVDAEATVAVVADRRDPIVPATLTEACFPNQKIHWTDCGQHWIPWAKPNLCASLIQEQIVTTSGPN